MLSASAANVVNGHLIEALPRLGDHSLFNGIAGPVFVPLASPLLRFPSLAALMAMTLRVLSTGLASPGIYLGNVLTSVVKRPNYTVRAIHR